MPGCLGEAQLVELTVRRCCENGMEDDSKSQIFSTFALTLGFIAIFIKESFFLFCANHLPPIHLYQIYLHNNIVGKKTSYWTSFWHMACVKDTIFNELHWFALQHYITRERLTAVCFQVEIYDGVLGALSTKHIFW